MKILVKIGAIGGLQSGPKKDGSGDWYARDIVLVANDDSMYPDEFCVRITNDFAKNCTLEKDKVYEADISFSKREYNGRIFQDLYLRNIMGASPQPSPKGEEAGENALF